jgi:hypothetical protein
VTLTPETPAGKEWAVKARVAKRSNESVFSLENSRTGINLNLVSARGGGCGGRRNCGWVPTLCSMTKPFPMSSIASILGLA